MTLRITQNEDQDAVTLKLEGKVAGPWVHELDRTWRSVAVSLGTKRLLVDLCGVTSIDMDGNRVLADLYQATCAQFIADNPMTRYFADQARLKNLTERK
jgi:anti-anti-sigma regulatory factor